MCGRAPQSANSVRVDRGATRRELFDDLARRGRNLELDARERGDRGRDVSEKVRRGSVYQAAPRHRTAGGDEPAPRGLGPAAPVVHEVLGAAMIGCDDDERLDASVAG